MDTQVHAEPKAEQKFNVVLEELRAAVDSNNEKLEGFDASAAASKTAVKALEEKLFAMEEKNQELVAQKSAEKTQYDELKGQFDLLEKQMRRPSGASSDEKLAVKAFEKAIVKGVQSLDEVELKTLRTDINEQGGFVTTEPEVLSEIIRDITEISPMRTIARVMSTSAQSVKVPRRKTLGSGEWVGECEQAPDTNSTYGVFEIPVNELAVSVEATLQQLRHSTVNMAQEIQRDAVEDFAFTEGTAFVSGDGVKKPEGFLTNTEVSSITSASSGVIDAEDLIDLAAELKFGYNPFYVFNRSTWAAITKLRADGATGEFLFNAGDFAAGIQNTIRGVPYVIAQDMPNVSANNLAVAYGDFQRGYLIVDGAELMVIRDEFTKAREGKVVFTFRRSVGGQVIQPEAIKLLKIKA